MSLKGTIETFAIADVLRLLSATNKSGRLHVTGPNRTGTVWVKEGSVCSTDATNTPFVLGHTDVVFQLLRFETGDFFFDTESEAPPTTDERTIDDVLVESETMRQQWEQAAELVSDQQAYVTLNPTIDAPSVTLDADAWAGVAAIGSGEVVSTIGDKLELGELKNAVLLNRLHDLGLITVDASGAPSNAAKTPARASSTQTGGATAIADDLSPSRDDSTDEDSDSDDGSVVEAADARRQLDALASTFSDDSEPNANGIAAAPISAAPVSAAPPAPPAPAAPAAVPAPAPSPSAAPPAPAGIAPAAPEAPAVKPAEPAGVAPAAPVAPVAPPAPAAPKAPAAPAAPATPAPSPLAERSVPAPPAPVAPTVPAPAAPEMPAAAPAARADRAPAMPAPPTAPGSVPAPSAAPTPAPAPAQAPTAITPPPAPVAPVAPPAPSIAPPPAPAPGGMAGSTRSIFDAPGEATPAAAPSSISPPPPPPPAPNGGIQPAAAVAAGTAGAAATAAAGLAAGKAAAGGATDPSDIARQLANLSPRAAEAIRASTGLADNDDNDA